MTSLTGPCDYREANRPCREPGSHQVQFDGRKQWLCDRHVKPEYHPPDLHKKLPGFIRRTIGRRTP